MAADPRWKENQAVHRAASGSANELVPALARIIETGAWREFVHPMHGVQRYDTFSAYCDGWVRVPAPAIEVMLEVTNCKRDALEVRRLLREETPPAAKPGEIGNGRSRGGNTTSTLDERNDAKGVLARLKRDRPDLAQQIIDGTLTPNKAAIQAGIRHPRASIRTDSIEAALTVILRHYSEDQLRAALDDL